MNAPTGVAVPAVTPFRLPKSGGDRVLRAEDLGAAIVFAPHPDDESLACGGTIAALRAVGAPVDVVVVTDGAASHPHSRTFPPDRVAMMRKREFLAALACLRVDERHAHFLNCADSDMPIASSAGRRELVGRVVALLRLKVPRTLLLPWRDDPHPDHRDTAQIVLAAVHALPLEQRPIFVLEYPVWSTDPVADAERVHAGCRVYRVDIMAMQPRKQAAIAAHRSQYAGVINDDPDGFQLSAEMLHDFQHASEELFFETVSE